MPELFTVLRWHLCRFVISRSGKVLKYRKKKKREREKRNKAWTETEGKTKIKKMSSRVQTETLDQRRNASSSERKGEKIRMCGTQWRSQRRSTPIILNFLCKTESKRAE